MSVNCVVQDGVVKSPTLRYAPDGKPEWRFTLVQTEKGWPLYLPCCAIGAAAERLASEIDEGQPIVITSGKLCYRKRQTKLGEQRRMEILVWSVDRLTASADRPHERSPDYTSEGEEVAPRVETPRPAGGRKGKPRYPKWRPEPAKPN